MARANVVQLRPRVKPFNLAEWAQAMDVVLGTKAVDPWVRYSEYHLGPTRACQHCGTHYTAHGIKRHEDKCVSNQATAAKRKRRKS